MRNVAAALRRRGRDARRRALRALDEAPARNEHRTSDRGPLEQLLSCDPGAAYGPVEIRDVTHRPCALLAGVLESADSPRCRFVGQSDIIGRISMSTPVGDSWSLPALEHSSHARADAPRPARRDRRRLDLAGRPPARDPPRPVARDEPRHRARGDPAARPGRPRRVQAAPRRRSCSRSPRATGSTSTSHARRSRSASRSASSAATSRSTSPGSRRRWPTSALRRRARRDRPRT